MAYVHVGNHPGELIPKGAIVALGVVIAVAIIAIAFAAYSTNAIAVTASVNNARIQSWVNQLADPQLTPTRHLAQQHLEESGSASIDSLLVALRSPNATLRSNAAEMLGFIASPQALGALSTTLANDSVPAVRSSAAWALGELNGMRAVSTLEGAAVLDSNFKVRQAAEGSLSAIRNRLAAAAGKDERLVSVFAVAPSQANVVYVSDFSSASVSRDGGKTWTTLAGTTPSRITALAVSPVNADVIYAGTESLGLYKSTNGGTTWNAMNQGLGLEPGVRLTITAIVIDAQDADRIYVARGVWLGTSHVVIQPTGVMSSADGAQTWEQVNLPATNEAITRFVIVNRELHALSGERVISLPL